MASAAKQKTTASLPQQLMALIRKNFLLAVVRRPIGFFICIYALPIAFLALLAHVPTFIKSNNKYGMATPRAVDNLASLIDKQFIIVKPDNLGPDVDIAVNALSAKIPNEYLKVISNEGDLKTLCLANLRGVSDCFASVTFMDSPQSKGKLPNTDPDYTGWDYEAFKKNHTWEYSIRTDPAKNSGNFDVNNHKTVAEDTLMPIQVAVSHAITNSTTVPAVMAYTHRTQAEQDREEQEMAVQMMGQIIGFLLFGTYYFHIYRHSSLITADRESGMSQLVDAMGGGLAPVARVLSWLAVFNISALPVMIILGVLYGVILFPTTGVGLMIGWQILIGLATNSATVFAASFFQKARVSSIYIIGGFLLLAVGAQIWSGGHDPLPPPHGAYLFSIFSASASFVLFLQQMCLWELSGQAANVSEVPKPDYGLNSQSYNVTQGTMLGLLVFQIVLYPVLAILVEKYMHGIDFKNRSFVSEDVAQQGNAPGAVVAETFDLKKHFMPNLFTRIFCCGKRKDVKAVDGVSIKTHQGQILGLVGPNGSGKTTTLQMMAGFISPTSGSSSFQATPAQVGICPQRNTLWDELTVLEHVRVWSLIKATKLSEIELDQMLVACDLELKRNSQAKTLSGGQKRKLQLACMLVGNSTLCLIDEITSGLDPLSRRVIWDIILAQRAKRSIILTTHFMDEIDVLADHIVVLTKGKVKSQGAAAELKQLHGGGYKVHAPKAAAGMVSTTYPMHEHQDEVVFATPDSASAAALCGQFSGAGIDDISISGPQVEDVFLAVADNDEYDWTKGMPAKDDNDFVMSPARTTSFWHQVRTMFLKRATILKRLWWPYFYVLFLPLVITPFLKGVLPDDFEKKYEQPSCSNLQSSLYEGYPEEIWLSDGDDGCTSYSWEGGETYYTCDSIVLGPQKSLQDDVKEIMNNPPTTYEIRSFYEGSKNFSKLALISKDVDDFRHLLNDNGKVNAVGGFYLDEGKDDKPVIAYLQEGWGTPGFMMLNLWAQMDSGIPIIATSGGFAQEEESADGMGVMYVIFLTLLQALWPAAFALYPSIEKSRRVRSLEYANGVRRGPLWVAYGLFDAMFVFIIALGTTAIMSTHVGWAWNGPVWIMFPILLLYGVAATLLSYLVAHFVNGPLKGFLMTAIVSLVMYAVATVAFSVGVGYSEAGSVDQLTTGLTFGLNLFMPIANVFRAGVLGFNVLAVGCKDGAILPPASIYAYGGPILYLVLQVIALLLLVIWLEGDMALFHRKQSRPDSSGTSVVDLSASEKATTVRSDEVKREATRVTATEADFMRALHVNKSFGSNHAVKDVTFGLPEGEVMALIGPNGAGKSSVVNIIQSELRADSGQIMLKGEDSRTRSAQKYLGVCPQHDALDMLNTRDQLTFYARVRGIDNIKENVDHVLNRLGLAPHAKTLASKLSGGNKRKLSLAIALIGAPPVLVLDEPTSSMDAVAKRQFWRIIRDITPGRSVLLTTHSMEEADYLGTRTSIMSKSLLAVGTTQALRKRYNNLYYISILLTSAPSSSLEEMESVRAWVEANIPNAKLEREILGGQIRFTVPGAEEAGLSGGRRKNPVAEVIEILERNKASVGIEYYSIGGATLERVFLEVVRENNVAEEDGVQKRGWVRRLLRK